MRAATLHPVVIAVDHLQRRLGGRCCKLGLIHRLGRCPKDSGWLVRRPGRQLFVAGVACRRCPFPLAAGLLACWCSQLLAVGVRETQCAAQFATAVVRVALLRRAAGRRRCRRLGFPGRVLAWCCWRDRPGTCRRPSPRCIASQRSALQVRSRHRRRRRRRQCHCLRRSWHDVEGSQKIASQTPIDVYSGDEGAHPKPA